MKRNNNPNPSPSGEGHGEGFSGRFLSPDPLVSNAGFTQDYNRYSYVLNNPLSYTDPSGYIRISLELMNIITHLCDLIPDHGGGSWTPENGFHLFSDREINNFIDSYYVSEGYKLTFKLISGHSSRFVNKQGLVDKKWPFGYIRLPHLRIMLEKTGNLYLESRYNFVNGDNAGSGGMTLINTMEAKTRLIQ